MFICFNQSNEEFYALFLHFGTKPAVLKINPILSCYFVDPFGLSFLDWLKQTNICDEFSGLDRRFEEMDREFGPKKLTSGRVWTVIFGTHKIARLDGRY